MSYPQEYDYEFVSMPSVEQEARMTVMRCLVDPDVFDNMTDLDSEPGEFARVFARFADPLVAWVLTGKVAAPEDQGDRARWVFPREPGPEVTLILDRYSRTWERNGAGWVESDMPEVARRQNPSTSWDNLFAHYAPLTAAPTPNPTAAGTTPAA